MASNRPSRQCSRYALTPTIILQMDPLDTVVLVGECVNISDYDREVSVMSSKIACDPFRSLMSIRGDDIQIIEQSRQLRTVEIPLSLDEDGRVVKNARASLKALLGKQNILLYKNAMYRVPSSLPPVSAKMQTYELDFPFQKSHDMVIPAKFNPTDHGQLLMSLIDVRKDLTVINMQNRQKDRVDLFAHLTAIRPINDDKSYAISNGRNDGSSPHRSYSVPTSMALPVPPLVQRRSLSNTSGSVGWSGGAAEGGQHVIIRCLSLAMKLGVVEPLFCSIALYDAKRKLKVSENFNFSLNSPSLDPLLAKYSDGGGDNITKSTTAIFNLHFPHPDVYAVLRVERVLSGDPADVIEAYTNPSTKAASKMKSNAPDQCERLGELRQALCWSLIPLFNRRGELEEGRIEVTQLFRPDIHMMRDDELFGLVADYCRDVNLRRLKTLTGTFALEVSGDLSKMTCSQIVTPTLDHIISEENLQGSDVAREIREINITGVFEPYEELFNSFFVYPLHVNFSSRGDNAKCRNVSCRVELFDDDDFVSAAAADRCGRRIIFGKWPGPSLRRSAYTAVTYHDKAPRFYDEIKLQLPINLTKMHHLVFTFFHINCKGEKKHTSGGSLFNPVGYAVLPLLETSSDGFERIVTGDRELSVFSDLTPGYLTRLDEQKALDNGRPLMSIVTSQISSVFASYPNLYRFFALAARFDEGNSISDTAMAQSIESLMEPSRKNNDDLVRFLSPLLSELLRVFISPKLSDSSAIRVFGVLCHILSLINGARRHVGPAPALLHFADAVYYNVDNTRPLHRRLVVTYSQNVKDCPTHSVWFLLKLIEKSLLLHIGGTEGLRFGRMDKYDSIELNEIRELVGKLLEHTDVLFNVGDRSDAKRLSSAVAEFLRNLLGFMDRGFIFDFVQEYMIKPLKSNNVGLLSIRLAFIRTICEYEHLVPISLVLCAGEEPVTTLNIKFRRRHFLISVMLDTVSGLLGHSSRELQKEAVQSMMSLLRRVSYDPRYMNDRPYRERVISLLFPFLAIALDVVDRLHVLWTPSDLPPNAIDYEDSRSIIFCCMHILKWTPRQTLKMWWDQQSKVRQFALLSLLRLSIIATEYLDSTNMRLKSDALSMASQLSEHFRWRRLSTSENAESVPDSRTSFALSLDSGINGDGNVMHTDARLGLYRDATTQQREEYQKNFSIMEGQAAYEMGMIVLDVLDAYSRDFHAFLAGVTQPTPSSDHFIAVILALLLTSPSQALLTNTLDMLRSLACRIEKMFFTGNTTYLDQIINELLRFCNASSPEIRSAISITLYALVKMNYAAVHNFLRFQIISTVALSKFVGTTQNLHVANIHRCLATVAAYATNDLANGKEFTNEVVNMCDRLYAILRDTLNMQDHKDDSEMYSDMQYRVAKGYSHSPQLRVVWLENMAETHLQNQNYAEAAICLVHMAAIVSEYVGAIMPPGSVLPSGCLEFLQVSANVGEEKASAEHIESVASSLVNAGTCWNEEGLLLLMERTVKELKSADMYESVNALYKVILPMYENKRAFEKLVICYSNLAGVNQSIISMTGKRVLGTYFRVTFFGHEFGELDGLDFIYKEPKVTPLASISIRLKEFYSKLLPSGVEILKDSGTVNRSKLDVTKSYVQITYVAPYFDEHEIEKRVTYFERNNNVDCFIFETPFTKDGKAHGELSEQWKRKTILKTAVSFPYLTKRVRVISTKEVVVDPLECSIEEISRKAADLRASVQAKPVDVKLMQMQLQGSVSATVNTGPLQIAHVFLSHEAAAMYPLKKQNQLREHFKEFLTYCGEALALNEMLIKQDQYEYQKDLKSKFDSLTADLSPYIHIHDAEESEL